LHTFIHYCTHDSTWVDNFPRRDSMQTYMPNFLIVKLRGRGEAEHTVSMYVFCNTKRDSTWVYDFSRKV